ncbi:hypothetical protein [Paenibacillus durus]|uniref:Uncharacterized protein n=1 Tax=Paenibacillus durus TaxID=44251 RepID=A0A089IXE5_PAEDU|nr:hypothetical protein [Paenibacillus durus]AIQ13629.1 hypothetical protein PDUR_18180 [Paenibacillus durus]
MLFKRSDKGAGATLPTLPNLPNTVVFGEDSAQPKTVQVRKITIAQWRELFGAIQTLPQLLVSVISAPADRRVAFALVALEQSLGDFVRVVSVLTGIDTEWIDENASVDEILAYLTAVASVNNFGEMLKNVQGVLNLGIPKTAESAEQGAE